LPIYTEKDGDERLPRNIFIKILIFVTLIGVSAVVMRPLQSALHMGMNHIRTNIIERIEEYTDMKLLYSSIRPTIFGSFDIRNLKFLKDEDAILSVSRARITFSMSELLFKRKLAVRTILLEKSVLNIDIERDSSLIQAFSSSQDKDGEKKNDKELIQRLADFFPEKPDFKIRDCSASVTGGALEYNVQKVNIDINGNKDQLSFNGKFIAGVNSSSMFSKSYGIKTSVAIDGVCKPNLEDASAQITFSSFLVSAQENNAGGFFLKPLSMQEEIFNTRPFIVDFIFKDRLISLGTSGGGERFNASFEYNTGTNRMSTAMNCDNFMLSDIISFANNRKDVEHLLTLAVSGKASFTHEKNTGLKYYDVNIHGSNESVSEDSFAVIVSGSEKSIAFDEFWFIASARSAKAGLFQGKFSLAGKMGINTLTPAGQILFENFSLTGDDFFNAAFNVSGNKKEISILSKRASVGSCVLNDINIFIFPSERDLGLIAGALREENGSVSLEATLNYSPLQFDSSLAIDSFSLLDIVEIFRPFTDRANIPPVAGLYLQDTSVIAEVFFTTDFNQFVYNAPNIQINAGDVNGSLSFSGTDRQFSLSEGIFFVNEKDFLVSAQVNFSNPMDLLFSMNASYLDFSWHIQGQVLDRTTLVIRDPNGLHMYGNISNTGALSGYLEGISFPIPVNGRPYYLNFYITLRYTSRDFWSFDIAHFEANDFNSMQNGENLRITGAADQDGATFKDIVYSDYTGKLSGNADFTWDRDFSNVQFITNMTDGIEGGELLYIDGLLEKKHFNLNAYVSQMRVDRFMKTNIPIFVNGNTAISWDSHKSFNAQLNLDSLNAMLRDDPLHASAEIIFTNDDFIVQDLRFDYAQMNAQLPLAQISRADGNANASMDIKGFVLEKWLEGKIVLDVNFLQINSWVEIKEALGSIDGIISAENLVYAEEEQEPFNIKFANNESGFSVSGGPGNLLRMEMDKEGDFFAGLSSPFPIHVSVAGSYRDGLIDAHCNDFFIDLKAIWDLVNPSESFLFAGGYITAQLDIRGPIGNPEFFGSGRGSSFRMVVPNYLTEEIKPIPFDIAFEGSEMTFGPVPSVVGRGGGTIAGWFIYKDWIPDNFGLDIRVPKESPIPYGLNITGFLAKGDVSGDLALVLDNSTLDISGILLANNTEMGLSIEEIMARSPETETVSGSSTTTIVNLEITTGSVVEFAWPNSSTPILRANPEMGTIVSVSADTLTGQYTLNTDIKIRSGELNYFDRSFYIRQGNLVFKENEREFSPHITARAEIRDRTDNGPVTISMIIENEPLLNFIPRFEANPALTQFEIYSLLGQGINIAGTGDNKGTTQMVLSSTADILGQFIGMRTLEKYVRNFLRLDMFSIRTKVLQNVVSSAAEAGLGLSPVDRNNRVGNYFDNTTIFVGKYVGQDMFIQGMLSVSYDENNPGYGGLKLEPDIGIELQSPLFSIRWDFFPYNPQNWWVNDNSITLTWSKSF